MKKSILLIIALCFTVISFAQKREKIKGSKVVKTIQKEIAAFETLEVEDNLEVILVKGEKCGLEIDADENLHEAIGISLNGKALRLTTTKEISGFKKLAVKVTYDPNFKSLTVRHEASINAISPLDVENFTFKSYDFSKIYTYITANSFTLSMNDKSKAELNIKGEDITLELNKEVELKALIAANNLKLDMYLKTKANVEGDSNDFKLRIDNSADFIGNKLTAKSATIIAEGNTKAKVNIANTGIVEASGNTVIEFYGDAKLELKKFADNAILMKKSLK